MQDAGSYDYIIIGAGSAGSVLAYHLGKDPKLRILVLEAGDDDRAVIVQMPSALTIPMNTTRFNWGMETEPEPGLDGRRVNLPRGRGLGGSSSINGMCWVRGNPMDYELWEALGAEGWRWSNVLPYFQRLEAVREGGPLRGTDGPIKVARGPEKNPLYHAFVRAAVQAGYAPSQYEPAPARRLWPDGDERRRRAALFGGGGLSAPGHGAWQCAGADRGFG